MLLQPPIGSAIVSFLIIILLCLPIHEFGHAWAAVKLGDMLPIQQGRLTLNPLRHIDWLGAALLALAGFGWAKPVQFNPYALRKAPNPRAGIFVVASAGPVMNVLLAVAAAVLFRLAWGALHVSFVTQVLYSLIVINLVLAVFNLIPVPPLDGSKILAMLLPMQYDNVMATLNQYGIFILIFLVFPLFNGQSIVSLVVMPIVSAATRLLTGL